MNNEKHLVSVVVICRNEEKFIARCLDSIIGNDYPKDRMEVLVVDGMSDDQTRAIVNKYQKRLPFVHLLDNPRKFTPFAMNIGAQNANGDYIIFVGSHCTYGKYYLSNSVRAADQSGADNVGGIWKIIPQGASFINQAIVAVSSSLLGAGNAYYRRGQAGGPREVDTVFGGCYKKEVFKKIGWFNERLARSQDMEFNMRLKKAGGKIMMFPDIICYYYPKSNFKDFFIHNFWDGVWAIWPLKIMKAPLKLRHYLPLLFILSFFGSGAFSFFWLPFLFLLFFELGLYFATNIYFSVKILPGKKEWRLLFILPIVFAARHFGYGLGSVFGLTKLISRNDNAFGKKF